MWFSVSYLWFLLGVCKDCSRYEYFLQQTLLTKGRKLLQLTLLFCLIFSERRGQNWRNAEERVASLNKSRDTSVRRTLSVTATPQAKDSIWHYKVELAPFENLSAASVGGGLRGGPCCVRSRQQSSALPSTLIVTPFWSALKPSLYCILKTPEQKRHNNHIVDRPTK